jgi:hypothetical protein
MRIESSVTSVSWIPLGATEGFARLAFGLLRVAHYDPPPPEPLGDVDELVGAGRARFANRLEAWIEVQDGRVVDAGQGGGGRSGRTRVGYGPASIAFASAPMPELRPEPEVGDGWVRFVQTAGGRMGLPAPRRVRGKPYFQVASASAWTTLQLILYADGRSEGSLVGASPFPRHWVYDHEGRLVEKSGTIDFEKWYRESYGENTPWGGEDTPAFVTAVETDLERALSESVLKIDDKLPRRRLGAGETLVEQGAEGDDLFVLLDGVLDVEVDGETVAEVGPGAILGERAAVEGGPRTATLRAVTPCRVVVLDPERISKYELAELALSRRREES